MRHNCEILKDIQSKCFLVVSETSWILFESCTFISLRIQKEKVCWIKCVRIPFLLIFPTKSAITRLCFVLKCTVIERSGQNIKWPHPERVSRFTITWSLEKQLPEVQTMTGMEHIAHMRCKLSILVQNHHPMVQTYAFKKLTMSKSKSCRTF